MVEHLHLMTDPNGQPSALSCMLRCIASKCALLYSLSTQVTQVPTCHLFGVTAGIE